MTDIAIAQPIFQRAMRPILSISKAAQAEIVTTIDHQYIVGLVVRLNIPSGWGMQQANQLTGTIQAITSSVSFTVDIDTREMDVFTGLLDLGDTDGSGDISGTITSNSVPFSIGQSFMIGSDFYLVVTDNGALYCDGIGSGTFNIATGVYTITASPASTIAYFNQVLYPKSLQSAQITPVGTYNGDLAAATRNISGTDFYN